jgi:DNA-directed RNA polymerase specialized sigma24 family protein
MIETEDLLTLFDALRRYSSETFIDHWPAALSRDEKVLSLAECGFARCVVLRPDWAGAHDGLQEELAEDVDHLLRLWILTDLGPGETRRLVLRLTAYVEQKRQRYYWRSAGGLLEAGKEAVDIAQDALEKTYRGKRKWDPRKKPLLDFLCAVADSELSNLVLSVGHRLREPSIEVYQAAVDGTSDPLPGPDAAIEEAELRERFRQSLSDDPDLVRFFELRWKDYSLDEISRETDLPKKKLYTLVRKLKRRYEQFENEKAASAGRSKERVPG